MCKIYISITYYLQHQVFLASCYQLSNKFRATTVLQNEKAMAQQLKSWLLNATRVLVVQRQIFINKILVLQVKSNS